MQREIHRAIMLILVNMIDTLGIKRGSTALYSMYLVAFFEE
jgi:hypothetical protein